jgi:hypothetical protein
MLADINIQGHVELLRHVWESPYWQDVWNDLATPVLTFADVGLPADASDALIWQFCQQQQLILITANRNDEGPDSLEATIRTYNSPDSLPVLTLADPDQLRQSKAYTGRVAERIMEYLIDLDKIHGTGRLYVP